MENQMNIPGGTAFGDAMTGAVPEPCCTAERQAVCCEPADKAGCCGTVPGGCGCQ